MRTDIEWYHGKCLTKKAIRMRPKQQSGNAKPTIRYKRRESFFHFFETREIPKYSGVDTFGSDNDDDDDDDIEEDYINWEEEDYEIGCKIRDEIIPFAIKLYGGGAYSYWRMGEEDDCYDDDDDDDDDEDDCDSENDDSDVSYD
eukprot:TRINITY_DN5712_c0_g5_i2.p1 TRINITY_DN5712_c0_g5~~TRINITY_DN5712_c0_g5_i2.p1  ORF type:complete len:144 (-),score=39.72 TRINITY_DN5712_c0_g5_i2:197-628(-)